jgi:photoactive yellow protein
MDVDMPEFPPATFDQASLHSRLESLTEPELDSLEFGVIGFDDQEIVTRYNATESRLAGLSPERVLGHGLFTVVAPCMNNFLVAQRFQDAAAAGQPLEVSIDYVFTLRMRPRKVKLRLLAAGVAGNRYVVVRWQPA